MLVVRLGHRDYERAASHLSLHGPFDHPSLSTSIKLFVAVEDTDETMGCSSLVPGSHRLPEGPPAAMHRVSEMPGHVKFVGKAGDALAMDIRCWHAAQPNHSGRPRESLIIQYAAFKWQQVGTLIDSVQRLEAADRIGDRPILRQMLGLQVAPELADKTPYPPADSVRWPHSWIGPNLYPLPSRHGADAEEVVAFRRDGCVMLPGLISGETLAQLQRDFRREQVTARERWAESTGGDESQPGADWDSSGKRRFFDLAGATVFETSPAYAAILTEPRLVSLLQEVVGEDVKVRVTARNAVPCWAVFSRRCCCVAVHQHPGAHGARQRRRPLLHKLAPRLRTRRPRPPVELPIRSCASPTCHGQNKGVDCDSTAQIRPCPRT